MGIEMIAPDCLVRRGVDCKNALLPHIDNLTRTALEAGWEPTEVALALMALATEQLKQLGYGQTLN
jgi:hypothetical protein